MAVALEQAKSTLWQLQTKNACNMSTTVDYEKALLCLFALAFTFFSSYPMPSPFFISSRIYSAFPYPPYTPDQGCNRRFLSRVSYLVIEQARVERQSHVWACNDIAVSKKR